MVVSIPLSGKSSIADYMVVASGTSTRQVGAMAHHLVQHIKAGGFDRPGVEGLGQCDWVLIDGGGKDAFSDTLRGDGRSIATPGVGLFLDR